MTTQSRLRELLEYSPATGLFVRIGKTGRKGVIGQIVGSVNKDGYLVIGIDGKTYYAHRLAFIYMTGECPPLVDHIDQNKGNNAWANMRSATKTINAYNSKDFAKNTSGFRGVSWHAIGGKWQSHCGPEYLGLFETKEAAHAAYLEAAGRLSCLAM